jgi:hypothetical protein
MAQAWPRFNSQNDEILELVLDGSPVAAHDPLKARL